MCEYEVQIESKNNLSVEIGIQCVHQDNPKIFEIENLYYKNAKICKLLGRLIYLNYSYSFRLFENYWIFLIIT